jgi:hypothetical protein
MQTHLPKSEPIRAALQNHACRVYFTNDHGDTMVKFDSADEELLKAERLKERVHPSTEAAEALANIFGRKNGLYDYINKHAAQQNNGIIRKSASAIEQG